MSLLIIVLIIIAVIAAVYLCLGYFFGRYIAREFLFSKNQSLSYTYSSCLDDGEFTGEEFSSYNFTNFSVESEFGYTLNGVFSAGTDPEKTIVFTHGHTWTWHGTVKFFPLYVKRGYNIITYNHRHHGNSGGDSCTAGYFEKSDLLKIADWAFKQFPETKTFGAMGISLGAATVLQYLPLDKRLTFAHADCPYSDVKVLYQHQLKQNHVPSFLKGIILYFCNRYFVRKNGFSLSQVSPIRDIMESSVPLLFVHGNEDTYVPASMSVSMAEKRKPRFPTTLLLVDDAAHAGSLSTDPELYRKTLEDFLNDVEG